MLDFDDLKNPLLGGGQAQATVEVGSRLVKMGHTLQVICSKYPGYKDRTENGITYKHIGLGSKNIRLNNLLYILALPFAVCTVRSDVIIECFTAPVSTMGTPFFTRLPVVAVPTSFDAQRFSKLYKFPFHLIEKAFLPHYKYFLPFTKSMANKITHLNPQAIYTIVPNGVAPELLALKNKKAQHILFLGRLDIEQKGLDLLLEAYSQIAAQVALPLLIAGDGPDKERVQQLVKQYKLQRSVRLVGSVTGKKKEQLLAESAFVVVPSREESFCLVALEALACGLPVVAFAIPGLSWAKTPAITKIKMYDASSYARAILEMTKTYKEKQSVAKAFAQNFTWEKTASKYSQFLLNVVNKAL